MREASNIAANPCPSCYLCGTEGRLLYRDLTDRLFSAPGRWTLKRCPAPDCGLLWLDPMPSEDEIWKAYATYYTHPDTPAGRPGLPVRIYEAVRDGYLSHRYGYSASRSTGLLWPLIYLHPGARTETDARIAYQRSPGPGRRVLDIGCGDGGWVEYLTRLGWEAEGIDLDGNAIAAGQRRGLKVRLGTVESETESGGFDLITMSHVLEHVHDPIGLLAGCHRLLRPEGTLVLFTPNAESWGHGRFGAGWLGLDPPRHLHLFSLSTLRTTLGRSGRWRLESLRTTIRGAGGNLTGSREISRRGRYRMATIFQMRLLGTIFAHAWYYRSWLTLRWKPEAGEELALIAHKA